MATLRITTNLKDRSITFSEDFLSDKDTLEIEISVPKQSDYDELSFEFTLNSGDTVVAKQLFPEPNEKYICSDQNFIGRSVVDDGISEGSTYDISFWCEESGERLESSYTFTIPETAPVEELPA